MASQAAGTEHQGGVQLVGTTRSTASRAPAAPSAEAAKAAAKLRGVKPWIVLGRYPAVSKLSKLEWQSLLRNGVLVTEAVAALLDTLSSFRVEDYRWGSDTPTAEVPLEESLGILIATIMTVPKKGINDPESLQRLGVFEDSFNVGLDMVNEHCRENRGEMRNYASAARLASFINKDPKLFVSRWFDAAVSFKTTNFAPLTVIEELPPVVTMDCKQTSGFIAMGEVGAAAYYQPQMRAGEQPLSPSKRARGSSSGRPRAYCFAFNFPFGCHDRHCTYVHAKNPSRAGRRSSTTLSTGARGRAGGSVSFGDGGSGTSGSATGDKHRSRSVGHGKGGGLGGEARSAGEGGARAKAADFLTHGKDKQGCGLSRVAGDLPRTAAQTRPKRTAARRSTRGWPQGSQQVWISTSAFMALR